MKKRKLFTGLLLLGAIIGLVSCGKETFTITFDTNDGSNIESIQVLEDGLIVAPTAPTKDGFTFGGWYKDEALTQEWKFDVDSVSGNVTLYAKWVQNSYTIKFDLNGGTGTAADQVVKHGEKVQLPTGITKEGYKLKSWYTDASLINPFINTGVKSNLTLYAKWESNLTYSGTHSGGATYNSEDGTYSFSVDLGEYDRVVIAFEGNRLSAAEESGLIITGAFNDSNKADWTTNLYCDIPDGAEEGASIDYTTFLCCSGIPATYTFTYDPESKLLDIQAKESADAVQIPEEGFFYQIKDNGRRPSSHNTIEVDADGNYVFEAELSQWWRIYMYFNGEGLKVTGDNVTITGDFGGWDADYTTKALYYDLENDGPFAFISDSAIANTKYKFTYTPANGDTKAILNIVADPDNAGEDEPTEDQEGLVATPAEDVEFAIWTEAGTVFRDSASSDAKHGVLANGYRLICIFDAEGKIAYLVVNIDNGYGSPAENSFYAHPDYADNASNPALTINGSAYKVSLPEGFFAVTGYDASAVAFIKKLTGVSFNNTDEAQLVLNNKNSVEHNIRVSYDSETSTVNVSEVEAEKPVDPNVPAEGIYFVYTVTAWEGETAYAKDTYPEATEITDNGDGTYTWKVELAAWKSIKFYLDGVLLEHGTDITLTGLVKTSGNGADWTDNLYYENDDLSKWFTCTGATYVFTYDSSANTINIAKYQEEVVEPENPEFVETTLTPNAVNQDALADAIAVWTTAGSKLKEVTDSSTGAGSWLGNGWRLYVVVDAEGRIAYLVVNAPNGYGGPNGTSYYANSYYSDYTQNPAFNILDGFGPWVEGGYVHNLFEVVVPEGGFAITANGTGTAAVIAALSNNTITDLSDPAINKRGIIADNIRLVLNEDNTVLVKEYVEGETEEPETPEKPVDPNVPAEGIYFVYTVTAWEGETPYAKDTYPEVTEITDNGDGTYTWEVELAAWKSIKFYLDGVLLEHGTDITLTGLVRTAEVGADWTDNLYYENDDLSKWFTCTGATYVFTYDSNAGTINVDKAEPIPAEGVYFVYTYGKDNVRTFPESAEIVDNKDGSYSFLAPIGAWRYVSVYNNGEVVDLSTLTISGDGWVDGSYDASVNGSLYFPDDHIRLMRSQNNEVEYLLTYNPTAGTLVIDNTEIANAQPETPESKPISLSEVLASVYSENIVYDAETQLGDSVFYALSRAKVNTSSNFGYEYRFQTGGKFSYSNMEKALKINVTGACEITVKFRTGSDGNERDCVIYSADGTALATLGTSSATGSLTEVAYSYKGEAGVIYVSSSVNGIDIFELTISPAKEETETPEEPETPEQVQTNFTVQAMSTGGAANNFKILWSDAQYAVTQAPTVSDFSVSVGSIALLDFATIFANENLIQFNVVTGAEPGRIVSVVLHTANGDYKLSLVIEGGEYKSFTEEAVTCNHTPVEDDDTEGSEPVQTNFTVQAMSTGGAANNFKILWSDAQYAVTQAPTVSDFSVSVGSIALLDFATIFANENLIQFNVVTGAEPERIVSVVLHTANGDYKLSLTIENGNYKSFTEEAVTCNHNA